MSGKVALCADEMSVRTPRLLGLEDIALDSLAWLCLFTNGTGLRSALLKRQPIEEIWIASSDDVPGVNLAAALRSDGFEGAIVLVSADMGGSCRSRAASAGVSAVETPEAFAQRFSVELRRRSRMEEFKRAGMEGAISAFHGNPRQGADAAQATHRNWGECQGSGRLVTVAGGSGGVGKSTVAACFAAQVALRDAKVLLLDCDLQFGMLRHVFAEEGHTTFEDVVADDFKLEKLARQAKAGSVTVIGAPEWLERSEVIEASVPGIASAATALFDVIVADLGADWSDMHASLVEMASCALFLVDQRSASIRTCRHAVELCRRMGMATGAFSFAVNRCSKAAPFTAFDVSCALGGVEVWEIHDGGFEVEELSSLGSMMELARSANPLARSVDALVQKILPSLEGAKVEADHPRHGFASLWGFNQKRRTRKRRRGEPIIIRTGAPRGTVDAVGPADDGWKGVIEDGDLENPGARQRNQSVREGES